MKHRSFYVLFALIVVASMVIAGCQPAATGTPEATTPPLRDNYVAMKVEAPNCDYGGEFKAIETVDKNTVKFTLC
jgi:hypothetical protein